ncbi:MAG: Nramp family divalent metal transporter [bacterium]|nr:Nramp family divalent metal transporter [bacterium]
MKTDEIIASIAETPARALDTAITDSSAAMRTVFSKTPATDARAYWHALGPGITTGASDDDPSGIATYSQTGAQYGFQLLWLAPLTFPLMGVVQEMCARIGLATGRGLAGNIGKTYPRSVLYLVTGLLFFANTFNLGANLGAVSKAFQMLVPGTPFVVAILGFTVISLGLQIFVSYSRYAKYLKYLTLVLLLYIATAFTLTDLPWDRIWRATLIPSFQVSRESLLLICAILGTTISPYLFFWQTSQEVEERKVASNVKAFKRHHTLNRKDIKKMRFDVWAGMLLSNVVMFFIIITCAATLFPNGISINTAEDAALALKPLAGNQAYTLFALGIIGTGLLSIPVLAGSAAYAFAESVKIKSGLNRKLHDAYGFYGVIIIAMGLGMVLNFVGLNPIKALIYSAVLNGLVAPVILFFIVRISSSKEAMGKWRNKAYTTFIGWFVVALMTLAGGAAIISLLI